MTHSQRRINQEPVGGTLLYKGCHLTVFKLLVQLAPPPPPPTTSSHLMQRHFTKKQLGVSSQRHLLHWSAHYTSKHGRGRHKVRAEQYWVEWFKLGAACCCNKLQRYKSTHPVPFFSVNFEGTSLIAEAEVSHQVPPRRKTLSNDWYLIKMRLISSNVWHR